jgi:hypothetical protein
MIHVFPYIYIYYFNETILNYQEVYPSLQNAFLCGEKFAYFCASITCITITNTAGQAGTHSCAGQKFHKLLTKKGSDHPYHIMSCLLELSPELTQPNILE